MENDVTNVGFTVDAGLIQRLGYELVGRAETAVSELIKNSYDADATVVDVDFINVSTQGGSLIISDNAPLRASILSTCFEPGAMQRDTEGATVLPLSIDATFIISTKEEFVQEPIAT